MHGVALPEVISVCFGKGKARFGCSGIAGLEQFEAIDDATKGIGCDLGALEQTAVDTGAVDFGDIVFFSVKARHDLLDGLKKLFRNDFACRSFIGADWGVCDTVFAVIVPPGLYRAPGKTAELSVFIEEVHLTNGLVASYVGGTSGVFESS